MRATSVALRKCETAMWAFRKGRELDRATREAFPQPMAPARNDATIVLGGSGFVGAHVVRAALEHAREIARKRRRRRGWVVSVSRDPERGLDGTETNLFTAKLDAIADPSPEPLFADLAPTRVILLTALSSIGDCERYPGLARALNVDFPRKIAEICERRSIRLVHVSTDLVFGATPPGDSGFREGDPPAPLSLYGRTKAEGEVAVLQACASALVVRLPLCWDEQGRGCGASEPLLDAVRKHAQVRLFTDEWRTPLHVADAARALVEVAFGTAHGWLHVAGPERITRYDLGLSLLIASGLDPTRARAAIQATTREKEGCEATRPADVCLDSTRARDLGLVLPGVSQSLKRVRESLTSRRPN